MDVAPDALGDMEQVGDRWITTVCHARDHLFGHRAYALRHADVSLSWAYQSDVAGA